MVPRCDSMSYTCASCCLRCRRLPAHVTLAGIRHDAMEDCQRSRVAPAGDLQPLVLTAWSAVHGLATLWIDGALPYKNLNPERLAPTVANLLSRMFAALARNPPSRARSVKRRSAE